MTLLSAWGNYPKVNATQSDFKNISQLKETNKAWSEYIAFGQGKSYGDSALNMNVIHSRSFSYFTNFDPESGLLELECGINLQDILKTFIPKGWFLPVTPGTSYISVGGAIAADVHGKNHHLDGSFCEHLSYLTLMIATGEVIKCSIHENSDLFFATCGGMGLTGVILTCGLKLKKISTSLIKQRSIKAKNLEEVFALFEDYKQSPYSVAWIDTLAKGSKRGRSILMSGDHLDLSQNQEKQGHQALKANDRKFKLCVPFTLPSFALNHFSVKLFNEVYYHKQFKPTEDSIIDYDPFFYPLDSIKDWNRIYGPNGFTQYQFVVPKEQGLEAIDLILKKSAEYGRSSFLAVLKLLGSKNKNLLSFPIEGYTLALDYKIRPDLFKLLTEFDHIVHDYGGRVYLAKDCRLDAKMFRLMYPEHQEFIALRAKYQLNKFSSLQSKRLCL